MNIEFKEKRFGLTANNHKLILNKKVWQEYPKQDKLFFIDNYAHISTINVPLVANEKELNYNTGFPILKPFFNQIIIKNMANATADYNINTNKAIKQFLEIKYNFINRTIFPDFKSILGDRAIIPFSSGKDSLSTLALANELNLSPIPIYINDTICPSENKLKLKFNKLIQKEFGFQSEIITNNIEKLNDYETYKQEESCLGYTHMTTGFSLLALPYLHFYKANQIIIGNQQDMNFSFTNKDGFKTYPSYDQTDEATHLQNLMIKQATNKQASVYSLIKPITNIAITKILWQRYPEFAKYQVSCDIADAYNEYRWCHQCNKCARTYLFTKAVNGDTKKLEFRDNLFDKQYKKYYSLFSEDKKEIDCYEKSTEARDQQLLAFYMAKDNAEGYLIDLFKLKYLEEAQEREDELKNKFFKIYKNNQIPNKLQNHLRSILKEELN